MFSKEITYSVFWNCFLIITGSTLFALGLKGIAEPHNFIAGGLYGISLAIYYLTDFLTPALLFAVLNIPIIIAGYIMLSRRFVLYSMLSMAVSTLVYSVFSYQFAISNQLYAAVVCQTVLVAELQFLALRVTYLLLILSIYILCNCCIFCYYFID